MGRRLVSMETDRTGFSPFVDVAINGMAAMFVFLAIYVALVPPNPVPELRILTTELPEAVWHRPYEAAIAVNGGSGKYRFQIEPMSALRQVRIGFNAETGKISGTAQPPADKKERTHTIGLTATVKDDSAQQESLDLTLRIVPAEIPFDPDSQKLRFASEQRDLPDAYLGRQYQYTLGILGGLEPYLVDVSGLPVGLSASEQGVIAGQADEASVPPRKDYADYRIQVGVVDRQSALLPEDIIREPSLSDKFSLRVRRISPIKLDNLLPLARQGCAYEGVIVANGGRGQLSYSLAGTALPAALSLEARTGWIRGVVQPLSQQDHAAVIKFRIRVDDEDPITEARTGEFEMVVAPPMRFAAPP